MMEFNKQTYHSIALKVLYQKSFDPNSIRQSVRPQNPFERGGTSR